MWIFSHVHRTLELAECRSRTRRPGSKVMWCFLAAPTGTAFMSCSSWWALYITAAALYCRLTNASSDDWARACSWSRYRRSIMFAKYDQLWLRAWTQQLQPEPRGFSNHVLISEDYIIPLVFGHIRRSKFNYSCVNSVKWQQQQAWTILFFSVCVWVLVQLSLWGPSGVLSRCWSEDMLQKSGSHVCTDLKTLFYD